MKLVSVVRNCAVLATTGRKTVQKLSYRELLEQAQTASQQGNWSLLNQCLQQLILGEENQLIETSLFVESETTNQLLHLALQVLEFGSFQERWEIAKAFSSFGTDAIAPLIEFLEDEDSDLEAQWFAIRILGEFNHPQVVTALTEVLQTSQSEEMSSMAVSALANMGKNAIVVLEDLLHQDSTRLFATQALGQIRHTETIPLLLQVLNDSDAQVRAIAIEALSSFHSPEITTALVQALQDMAVAVRRAAVAGLGFCHPQDTEDLDLVTQVRPLLRDFNIDVCRTSAIALGRLGTPDAIASLFEVLQSPHTPEILVIEIVRALGWSNTPESLDALEAALDQSFLSETVQIEILNTLGRIEQSELKSKAAQVLLNLLQRNPAFLESTLIRQSIALSLGQLGDPAALHPLIQWLADSDVGVRLHVISALKTLNSEAAYQQLEQLATTENENSALGRGVAIALNEWNL